MRVLVVEDDPRVAALLERALRENGHLARSARTGGQGLELARLQSWNVIVLDFMLPDMDGLAVCRDLRASGSRVPILFLTARDAVADRVAGLDSGADDYLTKPFALDEFLARVRALGRRSEDAIAQRVIAGDLVLDVDHQEATRGDRKIELTGRELRLLEVLMRSAGRILSKEQILEQVWGRESDAGANSVETYIHYLREKIDRGSERPLIRTVRGVGYTLRQ